MKLSPDWPEHLSRLLLIGLAAAVLFFGTWAALPDSVWNGLLTGLFPKLRPDSPRIAIDSFTHEQVPGELRLRLQLHNASSVPLEKVQAVLSIYDARGTQLNTLLYPIEPPQIVPGQSVQVTISFPGNAPISQYAVYFKTAAGEIIPHDKPF
jgi:hypothetical protein